MSKTRTKKEEELTLLRERMNGAKVTVFANFTGLKVKDIEELRRKGATEGVSVRVTKKTLLTKALGAEGSTNVLNGEIVALFGVDEIAAPKLAAAFAQKHQGLKMVGGYTEARVLSAQEVIALSVLPSRQELIASVVGSIRAPISGMVNVLAGNIRGLVQVLNAIVTK